MGYCISAKNILEFNIEACLGVFYQEADGLFYLLLQVKLHSNQRQKVIVPSQNRPEHPETAAMVPFDKP